MTQQEFEAEMMPHRPLLFAHAVKMSRNPADAEDIVSETYLKAWKNRGTYTPGTNGKAWLMRIATNVFIDLTRKRGREPQLQDADYVADADMYSAQSHTSTGLLSAEDEAMERITDPVVYAALMSLAVIFRTAVVLVDIEGWTYKETSEQLNIPMGTVMSRLSRGRSLLREALADRMLP